MSDKLTDIEEYQKSLEDLSKELNALGIKPPASQVADCLPSICESLLNSAWRLVQFIHCETMGIEKKNECFSLEKEQKMIDNLQSQQTKVAWLEKKLDEERSVLAQTKEINRKLNEDSTNFQKEIKKYANQVSLLTSKIEQSEGFYKCELNKREADCERLRDALRKLQGSSITSIRRDVVGKFAQLSTSSNPDEEDRISQMQYALNKLTGTNHELINENLVLRDTLCNLHTDLEKITDAAQTVILKKMPEDPRDGFSRSIFQLPLSQTMAKITDLNRRRMLQLNVLLSSLKDCMCDDMTN